MSRFFSRARALPVPLLSLALALLLSGCGSTIVTRKESHPVPPLPEDLVSRRQIRDDSRQVARTDAEISVRTTPQALLRWAGQDPKRLTRAAELVLQKSQTRQFDTPSERAGMALAACELAWRGLTASGVKASDWQSDPATATTVALYNTALAQFLQAHGDDLAAARGALTVETPFGPRVVVPDSASNSRYPVGYFDRLLPADNIKISGFTSRTRVSGLGVPLVGVRERTPERAIEMWLQPPGRGVYAPLNAVARFESSAKKTPRITVQISDLNRTATTRLRGRTVPLAGDFTAPLALSFQDINDLLIGVRALLNVGAVEDYTGIYLTEPVDPKRTPVLFLHGLSSSPLVWRNVVTKAMRDPRIRENYQFWYAFYSSGEPVAPTAALLRSRIASIRQSGDAAGNAPVSKNLLIVGYSMGGVIARALATDVGNHFWEAISDRPFEEIDLQPNDRARIKKWIFWKPDLTIKEVIFLATPHKGTRMADASFAQLGRKFIRLPTSFLQFQKRLFTALGSLIDNPQLPTRAFSGVDSLSPRSPIYTTFATAPIVSSATTHSIIGDRGRGDTPNSSDGVVGYWSSHLDSAVSEIIVPTGHDVQTDPHAEAEIQRVLIEALPSLER